MASCLCEKGGSKVASTIDELERKAKGTSSGRWKKPDGDESDHAEPAAPPSDHRAIGRGFGVGQLRSSWAWSLPQRRTPLLMGLLLLSGLGIYLLAGRNLLLSAHPGPAWHDDPRVRGSGALFPASCAHDFEDPRIDVVVVSGSVSCVLQRVVSGLFTNLLPGTGNIHVIVPPQLLAACQSMIEQPNRKIFTQGAEATLLEGVRTVRCHNESDILDKEFIFAPLANRTPNGRGWIMQPPLKNWYYQQLLKLLAVFRLPQLRPKFMMWDADNVLVRPYSPIVEPELEESPGRQNQPQSGCRGARRCGSFCKNQSSPVVTRFLIGGFTGGGHDYANATEALLKGMLPDRYDTVTHQALIQRELLVEMLRHICGGAPAWSSTAPGIALSDVQGEVHHHPAAGARDPEENGARRKSSSYASYCGRAIMGGVPHGAAEKALSEYQLYYTWVLRRYPHLVHIDAQTRFSRYHTGAHWYDCWKWDVRNYVERLKRGPRLVMQLSELTDSMRSK